MPTLRHALHEWWRRLTRAPADVVGPSMEPVLPHGARVRLALLLFPPRRGQIVVLDAPDSPGRWDIKRLIGLPGELVEWRRGQFRINGAALHEPYAPALGDDGDTGMMRLGPREYFVAGDNRPRSRDSRHYGPVARSRMIARVP